jgi:GDP-4-dehydro-6-deoxy-D-mannose reductase
VTGASGFVGRHVIERGHDRFDIVATGRGLRPAWLPAPVTWCTLDLLDRASVASLPNDLPYVLHLASETVPSRFSSYDPLVDSVEMTLNLCRHLRTGRLLFASSCLVYAASREPMTEATPLDPRGNYGLAKVLAEAIVQRASVSGGIETVIARPFNHIGSGMRPDLVIPSIVRRVRDSANGDVIEMAGLNSIRDFLDVADIVDAYFALLELPKLPQQTFNVASGVATSIDEIVRTVAKVLGKPIGDVRFAASVNSGDDTIAVVGDADLLRRTAAWAPRVGLQESLGKLVAALDAA